MRRDDIKFGLKAAVDATKSDDPATVYGETYPFAPMRMFFYYFVKCCIIILLFV